MDFHGSSLPQIWVIEALASSDHFETSLLLDLLKKTPQIFDDIGKNAREMVSLRLLESLFNNGARANHVLSPLSKTVRLDPSDHCEDVLHRILTETSVSQLKTAGPEMSKWDLEPFIKHKRSKVPKYALKQLKDAFSTRSDSVLASLREQSGLPVKSHAEHQAPVKDGNCDGITPRVEGNDADVGLPLPRDLPDENLVPVKKKRRTSESPSEQLCTNHTNPTKKNKHDAIFKNEQFVGGQLVSTGVQIQLTDVQHIEGESLGLERKTNVGNIGLLEPLEHDTNECTSSGLVDPNKVVPCGKQIPHSDPELKNKSKEQQRQNHHIEEEGGKNKACDLKQTEDVVDISSEDDGYHDERTTIDTNKKTFLSSQCTYSQDSLATTDWRELHLCMKCNTGGNLLSCTSDSCPIVIHESCLGLDVSFDTEETFYCPFCSYSRAISKYMEVKKYASLARKDLETFICLGTQNESNKQSSRSFGTDGVPRSDELNQITVVEKVSNHQCAKKVEFEQVGPSELRSDFSPPFERKAVESTDRLCQSLKGDKQDGKRMTEESQPPRGFSIAAEAVHNSHSETTSFKVPGTNGSEKHADVRSKKGVPRPPETNLPHKRKCSRNSQSADAEEISVKENEDSGASKYFMMEESQPPRGFSIAAEAVHNSHSETTSFQVPGTNGHEKHTDVRSKKGDPRPPETNLTHKRKCSRNSQSADAEEISEEDEDSGASKHAISVQKQERKILYPSIPLMKMRAKHRWTREEEETLEEGFRTLCGDFIDGYLPWKQILEFGKGKFHPSRTAVDMKDKWRNMCKAKSKSK